MHRMECMNSFLHMFRSHKWHFRLILYITKRIWKFAKLWIASFFLFTVNADLLDICMFQLLNKYKQIYYRFVPINQLINQLSESSIYWINKQLIISFTCVGVINVPRDIPRDHRVNDVCFGSRYLSFYVCVHTNRILITFIPSRH